MKTKYNIGDEVYVVAHINANPNRVDASKIDLKDSKDFWGIALHSAPVLIEEIHTFENRLGKRISYNTLDWEPLHPHSNCFPTLEEAQEECERRNEREWLKQDW